MVQHERQTIITKVTIVTSNRLQKINEKGWTSYSILNKIFM